MPDQLRDVFIASMRPIQGSAAQGAGDDPMWSPMSSTLIHGASEAVLVDTLVTNDQVGLDRGTRRQPDHHLCNPRPCRPLDRTRPTPAALPNAPGLATPEVVGRANFGTTHPPLAAYWLVSQMQILQHVRIFITMDIYSQVAA